MPSHSQTVLLDRTRPADAPIVLELRATPSSIPGARRDLTSMLDGIVPDEHLSDLRLAAAELLTNALDAAWRYAEVMQFAWCPYDTPIHLSVLPTPQWTRLDVRDPEPYMQAARPAGLMDESGRGLMLARASGYLDVTLAPDHKIVHLIVPIGDVALSPGRLVEALQVSPEEYLR